MVQISSSLTGIAALVALAGPSLTNAATVWVTQVVYQTETNVQTNVATVYVTETANAAATTPTATTAAATTSSTSEDIEIGVAAQVVADTTSTVSTVPASESSFQTVWTSAWTSEWTVYDTVDATTSTSSTATAAATSAVSTTISGSVDQDFATAILDVHNLKRALHGVSNLAWNDTLYQYAQAYADTYDCSGNLVHSGGDYGENLAVGYETEAAADAWYDEIKDYDYSNPGFSESTGHFTQMVWKDSTQVGCAYVSCSSKSCGQYTICSYYTPGNYVGAENFKENVLALV